MPDSSQLQPYFLAGQVSAPNTPQKRVVQEGSHANYCWSLRQNLNLKPAVSKIVEKRSFLVSFFHIYQIENA